MQEDDIELDSERSKIKQHVRIESMLFHAKGESMWKNGGLRTGKDFLQELEAARCSGARKIAGCTCVRVSACKILRVCKRTCDTVNGCVCACVCLCVYLCACTNGREHIQEC